MHNIKYIGIIQEVQCKKYIGINELARSSIIKKLYVRLNILNFILH